MTNIKLRVLASSRPRAAFAVLFGLVVLAICFSVALPAQAATGINKTISFQGKVVNSNGTNVPDTSYNFRFRIYTSQYPTDATNACSPGVNSCLWEETKNVSTINGIFQTYLGDTVSLPGNIDFNSDSLYLGVQFNGDTEMNPRIRLSAVPYAFNASKLGGLDSSSFVQLSPASQQTGSINVSSNITTGGTFQGNAIDTAAANAISVGATNATAINLGKTTGGTTMTFYGTQTFKPISTFDTQRSFEVQNSSGTALLTVDSADSRVGVLTYSTPPAYSLDVNGDIGTAGNLHFEAAGQKTLDAVTNAGGAGYVVTVKGGDAGSGNSNGGNLYLTGGAGAGTGARGVVKIDTPAFTTNTDTSCSSSCTITQSLIDNGAAVLVNAASTNLTITVPVPTNPIAGRIVYITGAPGSNDFTLAFNTGGNLVDVAMKQNTSATLVWSGTVWTAAGASSSTTLQAAYNNTLASAGGAEIVLNNTATSNGLTIRNAQSNPIIGPVFEVQSSIGTDLLSVNSAATEYASDGGAETSTGFSSHWTALGAGSVNKNTNMTYVATGQGSVQVNTPATINTGVRNIMATNLAASTTYQVSFTGMLDSTSSPMDGVLDVEYSRDGGTTLTQCTSMSTTTLVASDWSKVTCIFTTSATAATSSIMVIRQTDATARSFYVDNLSVTLETINSTPANVQIGGGSYGGNVTLFTLDRSSSPPVAAGNQTLYGSMYYDTSSGRIQCYQANGWGACGSAPDTFVNLSPEYAGAVLGGAGNGTPAGIGTMTAQFCSNQTGVLTLNTSLCGTGQALNYYQWTSPQNTQQTYSIYLSYQLPGGFKNFQGNDTVQLTARVDNTSNADVTYNMYRSQGGILTACGSETDVITQGGTQLPQANTWITYGINGNEATGCGFSTSSANNFVIFKINLKANSNANAYVGTLSFTITNQ